MATSTTLRYDDLADLLTRITGDEKHDRSALSTLDVLWVLYDRVLRVDPDDADDPDRDRFLLSKGHGPAAYYAVLAAKGFLDPDALDDFGAFDSILGHHPDRMLVPGVEISSGSLGHGLPIAVGTALALDAQQRPSRVVCLVGDAELDEGSNWEAVQLAGRLGLGRLPAGACLRSPSTTAPRRTTGPAASTRGSPPRAGTPNGSTAATTTRSSGRSRGPATGRASSWRR